MAFLYAEKLAQLAEPCKAPVALFRDKAVIRVYPGQYEYVRYILRIRKNNSQRTADGEDGWIMRIGDN